MLDRKTIDRAMPVNQFETNNIKIIILFVLLDCVFLHFSSFNHGYIYLQKRGKMVRMCN